MTQISNATTQRAIAKVLRYGSLLSTIIMGLGVVLLLMSGPWFLSFYSKPPGARVLLRGALYLAPPSLAEVGILLMLLTPIVRIGVAIAGFAGERDYRYALVGLGVLGVVLVSIAFAMG